MEVALFTALRCAMRESDAVPRLGLAANRQTRREKRNVKERHRSEPVLDWPRAMRLFTFRVMDVAECDASEKGRSGI